MKFSKGPAQALALEFYPESADAFAQELPRAKEALHNWKIKHGARCEMVMFTVVAAAELHVAIESLIRRACRGSGELGSVLQSVEVRIGFFIDPRGDPVKEDILAAGSGSNAAEANP
jgi:hypothetical protein